MDDQRISGAIARIEAAAERISASATSSSTANANAELVQKHEVLREEAALAISEIDQIIGSLGS